MPYPNEHSARVTDPGQYTSFARKNIAPGIDIILGIKEGKSEAQAYRFDKTKFTPQQAKDWLKEHDIKYISFEAASESKEAIDRRGFYYFDEVPETVEEGVLSEIQILRTGKWTHQQYGTFDIDEQDLKLFKENFDKNIRRVELAVDTEHFPEKGAAGWIKALVDRGKDGLFALIDWTKWGVEAIKSKLFKYISPEFDFEYVDPENGQKFKNVLYGVALTNRPFMKGMQPIVLSENLVNNVAEEIKGGREMDLKKLLGLLKLKEDATEADVETKITELMAIKPVELKDVKAELSLAETATVEDIVGKIKEIRSADGKGKVSLTEAEFTQLKADAKDGKDAMAKLKLSEATALVDKAFADGKITAAQKEWAGKYALSDPEGFKKFYEAAPKVVSTTETGSGGEGGEHKAADKVNQEAQKLMKEDKGMSFTDAVRTVLKDNPDLAKEYEKESSAQKL